MTTATATHTSHESDTDTDTAIVKLAMQGDRAAFGLLHARYAPMVHGIMLTRVAYEGPSYSQRFTPSAAATTVVARTSVRKLKRAHGRGDSCRSEVMSDLHTLVSGDPARGVRAAHSGGRLSRT